MTQSAIDQLFMISQNALGAKISNTKRFASIMTITFISTFLLASLILIYQLTYSGLNGSWMIMLLMLLSISSGSVCASYDKLKEVHTDQKMYVLRYLEYADMKAGDIPVAESFLLLLGADFADLYQPKPRNLLERINTKLRTKKQFHHVFEVFKNHGQSILQPYQY